MENKIKCPKCGRTERTKNVFHREKQRYKCKSYDCNYTGGKEVCPEHMKHRQ